MHKISKSLLDQHDVVWQSFYYVKDRNKVHIIWALCGCVQHQRTCIHTCSLHLRAIPWNIYCSGSVSVSVTPPPPPSHAVHTDKSHVLMTKGNHCSCAGALHQTSLSHTMGFSQLTLMSIVRRGGKNGTRWNSEQSWRKKKAFKYRNGRSALCQA